MRARIEEHSPVEPSPADYAALRCSRISKDLGHLELSPEYLEIFEANPSRDLPYHGNRHQLAVAILATRGSSYYALKTSARQSILLAALFHDFDYNLSQSERANIAAAQAAAGAAVRRLNPELWLSVEGLIAATEMPRSKPRSLAARILQDADLLMVTQPDFDGFLTGLTEENPGLVPDLRFPGEDALRTDWGKQLYGTAIELQETGGSIANPGEAVTVGYSHHPQTLSSRGFLVDKSIAVELEGLWAEGFETLASCGGDIGSISPGWNVPMRGYIAFASPAREHRLRLEASAQSIAEELEFYEREGRAVVVLRFDSGQFSQLFRYLLPN